MPRSEVSLLKVRQEAESVTTDFFQNSVLRYTHNKNWQVGIFSQR